MSIECSFSEFKTMASQFLKALPTHNDDEIENGWKCLGLAYLGMHETMWQSSAVILLNMAGREYLKEQAKRACTVN